MLNENSGPDGNLSWDDSRLAGETAAAMRDLASTVTDAPPLRLTATPDELGSGVRPSRQRWHGRRLRTWVVPAAAAVTVAAVAIALVLIRNIPNGSVPSPAPSATSAAPVGPAGTGGVPGYYVAWMRADRPYLVVGNTFTGKQFGSVPSPPGVRLDAVYGGSADNRTWLVQGTQVPGPGGLTVWYVLTINPDPGAGPGAENTLEMGSAGIPVSESPAGAVLSPDGKEVAVAVNGAQPSLRVYSLRTGALLHSWSAPSGKFAAVSAPADSWQYTQLTLRWTPDGRRLAFTWNAADIRVLDATAPDGSLLAVSSELIAIGTLAGLDVTDICNAWQGWEPVMGGRGVSGGTGVICGGGAKDIWPVTVRSTAGATCTQPIVGFLKSTLNSQGGSFMGVTTREPECPATAAPGDGAYIGWSNTDASVLIGSLVWDGHVRFGIFRGNRFTPLPKLPVSMPTPAGVLIGTDAW